MGSVPMPNLDNSLSVKQADGRDTYLEDFTTGGGEFQCNSCHELKPGEGWFGTNGQMSLEGPDISEGFKIPHLRNLYQKVGMFGSTGDASDGSTGMGDQIRGFGFLHDGSIDTIDQFLSFDVFEFNSQTAKDNVVDFQPDSSADGPVDLADIRSLVLLTGNTATYTCLPPSLGERVGIDRDGDGVLNRDEV